jgi:hypothetical protein
VPALQADAQMQPRFPYGEALLAARDAVRQDRQPDLVSMSTRHRQRTLANSVPGDIAQTREIA